MNLPDPEYQQLRNWAGNVTFRPRRVERPGSMEQLREVVGSSARVRALGTGHSFSPVADTDGVLVSLERMPQVMDVDAAAATAVVGAGARWGEVAPEVHRHGLALHNMGSLPHISVAGSVATGTHGSGSRLGCLASAVVGVEMVTADGGVRWLRRGEPDFAGSVVALGALGVVTRLELDLVPAFDVEQVVWDGLPYSAAVQEFDAVMDCARSVSLFTSWTRDAFEQVWVKRDVGDPPADLAWTGACAAEAARHPVPAMPPGACTVQGGRPGPWFERIPHFRLEFTPSSGAELQTEYLLPRAQASRALEAIGSVRRAVAPVLQVSEIRTVAADDLWLSPFHDRDSVAIHFTWIEDAAAVAPAVAAVEGALRPLDVRPHWGKVFDLNPDLVRSSYPRMDDFVDLHRRLDPTGKFANQFVDRYVRR